MMQCQICSSERIIKCRSNVNNCRKCGHTFALIPKSQRGQYDDNYFKCHKNWFEHPDYRLFKIIKKYVAGKKILDVGCGNGSFIGNLSLDYDCVGIDLNAPADNSGSKRKFIKADFMQFNFNGEKFDTVVSLSTIEYLESPVKFIGKIKKLLRKNGKLIITTPNNGSLLFKTARFLDLCGINAAYDRIYNRHDLQHFSLNSISLLLSKSNLKINKIIKYNNSLSTIDIPNDNIIYKLLVYLIYFVSNLIGQQTFIMVVAQN